ncbi:MAG: CsgG/HfaB family protein [Chitinispirillales bacterium]|jgi:hypothetical protein|nr:CsgG/HfaB family protein [Chitinispirillales bacterium]
MRAKNFLAKATLVASVVLFAACAATASKEDKKKAAAMYGDVIAKAGQSEVVVENTLPSPLSILIDGKLEGSVKASSAARITVPDGNHYIKVVSAARGGGNSKDVQFYTKGKRFFFKATGPSVGTVYLSRENAYDLAVAPASPGELAAAEAAKDAPLSETAIGKDKAAMFDRLDQQVAPAQPAQAQAAAPAQPSTPARSGASAAPPAAAQAAPAAPKFPTVNGRKPHIAVYVTGDKTDSEKKALGTKMLVALVNSGKFVAVERSDDFLSEIDNEHKKQREGAVDDSQVSKLGKQFGVQYVCVANIAAAFGGHQVSARIINVETAVVVAVGEDDSPLRNMDDLSNVSFRVTRALLKE